MNRNLHILGLIILCLLGQYNAIAQTCSVNAGVNSRICISNSMTLIGNSTGAISTAAVWALVSGPNVPTITSPSSATTSVTGFVAGTYRFRYHAICSDASVASDTVEVIVDSIPVFTAGTDTFVCGTRRVMNATLPLGATGLWSAEPLPGSAVVTTVTFSSNAPNADMNLPTTFYCPRQYYAIYSVTQGACTARDTAIVSSGGQSEFFTALGFPDVTICGTTYAPSTIYYSGCGFSYSHVQLAGPSIATVFNNYASAFQPVFTNLTTGIYTFALAVTKCDGVVLRDTFNLTVGSTVPVTFPNIGSPFKCPYEFDTVYYTQPITSLLPGESITYNLAGMFGYAPGGSWIPPTLDTIGDVLRFRNVNHPDTNAASFWYIGVPYTVTNGICTTINYVYLYLYPPMGNISYQPIVNLPCGATSGNIAIPTYGTGIGYGFFSPTTILSPSGAPVPTFLDLGNGQYLASGLQPGRYVFSFQYHKSNSFNCRTRTAVVEVNVSAVGGASNAGTNQVLPCGTDSSTLAGNAPLAGQTGTWQLVSGPSTVVLTNPNSPSLLIKNLLPGVYTFRWAISNGVTCPASSDDMQVIVTPSSPTSIAGADRTVCYGYATSLIGNAPSLGGTGRWRQIGGPSVTIADTTAATTTFSGSIASTVYTFTWTLTNPCGTDTDTVVITTTASQGPSNAVISSSDLCVTTTGFSTTSLSAVAPTTGTGTWSQLSGPAVATISSPTSATTSVSGMGTLGEYKYVWTVTAAGCDTLRDTVSIANRGTAALAANAGLDKYICADTVRMSATTPTLGIGTWTQIGGPGSTIDSTNKASALLSGLVNGSTYDYIWTVSLGVCPVARDTVHVGVSSLPSNAIARADTFSCLVPLSGTLTLPLTATSPTSGIGAWSIIQTPPLGTVIANPGMASTTASIRGGITKFVWQVINGACPASRDTVTFEIVPRADAPSALNLCETYSQSLLGSQPGSGSVLWSQISGPTTATITQPTSPYTAVTNMATGVYKFKYSLTHPTIGCNSEDSITITNSTRPVANARRDSIFCYLPTGVTPLYLIADTPSLGTGAWSRLSGAGTVGFAPSTVANPTIATVSSTVSSPGWGLQQFRWTVTNGACIAIDVKDVMIERLPNPGILFTPTTACNDSFTVTGTAPSLAFNYAWSMPKARIKDTAGIGLLGPIANNFLISDTNSIYLTITNLATGCTAKDSTAIIVNCSYLPLPLNFLSVQSKVKDCSVQLQWTFNTEGNSRIQHFVIERSNDGANYSVIATALANMRAYTDVPNANGQWYYRIKAVGIDNEVAYTPNQVVNMSNCISKGLLVYPNPASVQLNIELKTSTINNFYQLIDVLGRVVLSGVLSANTVNKIDVDTIVPGVYTLKVQTDKVVETLQVHIK